MSYVSKPSATEYVIQAIRNTKRYLPDYFMSTLIQRLPGGAGSVYYQFVEPDELERALVESIWTETLHPEVMKNCRVFTTPLAGRFGLVEIDSTPYDTFFTAEDRKKTGKISLTIGGQRGEIVDDTYLITGMESKHVVVFTFHPGPPIRPSIVKSKDIPHGCKISKSDAISLGFKWAKLI